MAKLNESDSALPFAAAVTAMTLGTGKRLMRNFSYYKQNSSHTVLRRECIDIFNEIRMNVFGLQNLCLDDEGSAGTSSFKVMLAKQIQDNLEQLHRNLLFYDVDHIVTLIRKIDRLRSFWSDSSDAEFYTGNLSASIDTHVVSQFADIRDLLLELPSSSD